jgi:hypothetical protein
MGFHKGGKIIPLPWGYKQGGTKKNGRVVPNCVPVN